MKKALFYSCILFIFITSNYNCKKKADEQKDGPETTTISGRDKALKIYSEQCSPCHGEKGLGDGPSAGNTKPRNFKAASKDWKNGSTNEGILKTLEQGIPGTAMSSYKHLNEIDRKALAEYIQELMKN